VIDITGTVTGHRIPGNRNRRVPDHIWAEIAESSVPWKSLDAESGEGRQGHHLSVLNAPL